MRHNIISKSIISTLLAFSFISMPISVLADSMTSGNYKIERDSMNFGGARGTSASYAIEDTGGETATGDSQSANENVHAGYQQSDVSSEAGGGVSESSGSGTAGGRSPYAVNVLNFTAAPRENHIYLSWQYPIVNNITSVLIVRSDKFFPTSLNDGEVIFEGNSTDAIDWNVIPGRDYYYALFAKNIFGQYSSGVLAHALIPIEGQPIAPPGDIFIDAPQAGDIHPVVQSLTLLDFDFIQDGIKLEKAGNTVAIDGKKNLTIQLGYDKIPEIFKTIAITLSDPDDSSKKFSFLLRVNEDKTAYEATIGALGKSGDYRLDAIILDYKNQSLKRLDGVLKAFVWGSVAELLMNKRSGFNILWLIILLIIILIIVLLSYKKKKTAIAIIILAILLGLSSSVLAAINKKINYQGKLTNSSDVAVDDGTYAMEFKLYTASSGGSALWTETLSGVNEVTVTDGLFSVMLGSVTSLATVDFNQTLYLGVNIESDGEMSPRKVIGAVPAAFVADTLDNLSSEQFLRSDASNSTSTISTFLTFVQDGAGKIAEFFGPSSASVLSLLSGGNVGIGTTTPGTILSIGDTGDNTINISNTATSTFGTGINLRTGCFAVNGTCLGGSSYSDNDVNSYIHASTTIPKTYTANIFTANQTFSDGITLGTALSIANGGTGQTSFGQGWLHSDGTILTSSTSPTVNYIMATSTTATSTFPNLEINNRFLSNNALIEINGNVEDFFKVHVLGTAHALHLGRHEAGGVHMSINNDVTGHGTSDGSLVGIDASGNMTIRQLENLDIEFETNNVQTAVLTSGGNLGIGTTSPYAKLSVDGRGIFNQDVRADYFTATSSTQTSTFPYASTTALSSSGSAYFATSGGNVGIGTAAPSSKLDFGGSGNLTNFGAASTVLSNTVLSLNSSAGVTLRNIATQDGSTLTLATTNSSGNLNHLIFSPEGTQRMILTGTGNFGIGTTSPYAPLSVVGQAVAAYFTATTSTASTFPYASSTAQTISGSLYLGSLDGPLQANNGAVSATTSIGVLYGGTGQTSFGQGWLHSDGTTFTSSTSPTVNYITSTSTATSTFAGSIAVTEANATSTFAGGIDLSDGCFAKNGVCLPSGTVTGSGSDNQIATWSGASSLDGGSDFTFDSIADTLTVSATAESGTTRLITAGLDGGGSKVFEVVQDGTVLLNGANYPAGIGVSSSTPTAKLGIKGSSSGLFQTRLIAASDESDVDKFTVSNLGVGYLATKLGIGTTTTAFPLGVKTTDTGFASGIYNSNAGGSGLIIETGTSVTTEPMFMVKYAGANPTVIDCHGTADIDNAECEFNANFDLDPTGSAAHSLTGVSSISASGDITSGTFTDTSFVTNGALYSSGGIIASEAGYTYNDSTNLLTVANVAVTDTDAESFRVGSASAGVINMGTSNITAGAFTGGFDINTNTNGGFRIVLGSNTNFQTFGAGYTADTSLQGDMYFDYGGGATTRGAVFWRNINRSTETAMQVSPESLVGIGTVAQTAVLHVASTTSGVQDLFKSVGGAAGNQAGTFVHTGSGNTTCANCVGIGTTSPWRVFDVNGSVGMKGLTNDGSGNYICLSASNEITYNATACAGASTERVKHDIQSLTVSGIDAVNSLRPVSFIYNLDVAPNDSSLHLGFIAEEVDKINKDLVVYDKDGLPKSVKYQEFVPIIVKAIQEQQIQIRVLQNASSTSASVVNNIINNNIDPEALASSTAEKLASSTPSFMNRVSIAVMDYIKSASEWVFAKISATLAIFDRVETQTLCVGQTCVTEDELKALLANANVQATTPKVIVEVAPEAPVVITPPDPIATTTPEIATSTPEIIAPPPVDVVVEEKEEVEENKIEEVKEEPEVVVEEHPVVEEAPEEDVVEESVVEEAPPGEEANVPDSPVIEP